jgi:hypothetical protein
LLRWDAERWFIELPRPVEAAAGKAHGARATLTLRVASAELPAELAALLRAAPEARGRWEALSLSRQRMAREEVLAAKASAARPRRASEARAPCPPATEVHLGMVQRTGGHPGGMVAGDAAEVIWEARIDVRMAAGREAFRGPPVNGPPKERFIYLAGEGRLSGEMQGGFRRAKLRLDAVPAKVCVAAAASGVLLGELDLRDGNGWPIGGSVRPPKIRWRVGGS